MIAHRFPDRRISLPKVLSPLATGPLLSFSQVSVMSSVFSHDSCCKQWTGRKEWQTDKGSNKFSFFFSQVSVQILWLPLKNLILKNVPWDVVKNRKKESKTKKSKREFSWFASLPSHSPSRRTKGQRACNLPDGMKSFKRGKRQKKKDPRIDCREFT